MILGLISNAQVKVGSTGKVSMDQAIPNENRSLYIHNSQTSGGTHGIFVKKAGSNYGHAYGVKGEISEGQNDGYLRGVYGSAMRSNNVNYSRSYGLYGMAGNYTSGYNYGVFGRLKGANNGAAIYGTVQGGIEVHAKYAGFFDGDVKVTNTLTAVTLTESDRRLKENIETFKNKETALEKLMKLNPVSYNYKNNRPEFGPISKSDTGAAPQVIDSSLVNRKHFGFIAQELESVYPDLVYNNAEGVKSINYTELIPVLVRAIKEQQNRFNKTEKEKTNQIKALKTKVAELEREFERIKTQCCFWDDDNDQKTASETDNENNEKTTSEKGNESMLNEQQPRLYQNSPNPFNETTRIEYYLPETITKARLYIYNMQGRQVKNFDVRKTGRGSITLEGSSMQPGMYMYSLIADGMEVDTKKMILTR
jgi:hypothetical protein